MVLTTASNVLAIIPARGGSKGIPKKNITDLCGIPLIAWTIKASLGAACISKTIVSTDDDEILNLASEFGADTLLRPNYLGLDTTPTLPVVMHVIESLGAEIENFKFIALLQPTSPLRTSFHIEEAYQRLLDKNASAIISVVQPEHSPLKSFIINDGRLNGIVNDEYPFMRRQDLPVSFLANGAIYIVDIKEFIKLQSFLTDNTTYYLMNELDSVDIDTEFDLNRVKKLLAIN